MKIAINAYRLTGQQAGVGRYLSGILSAWKSADVEDHIDLICPRLGNHLKSYVWKHCQVVETGCSHKNFVWENLVLPRFVRGADVLFCPSNFVPIRSNIATIVTIMDLAHEVLPQSIPIYWLWRLRLGVRWAAKRASVVITISECTKRDICRFYNINSDKVFVTYLGVAPVFKPIERDYARMLVSKQFGIQRPYILYVGSIFPRRNVSRLIEAFSIASRHLPGHDLVLAGNNFQGLDIAKVGGRLFKDGIIRHLGCPNDDQLLLLYNAAEIFIYPSSYEGFGLPVIEAMACGTPVITGNNSSLKEIGSGAAFLVDVNSTEAIKGALILLANDVRYQNELREKGLCRAEQFTWEKTAADTLDIIHRAGRQMCE